MLDPRIRRRVFTILKVNFPKLATAEEHYNLILSNCLEELEASISSAETVKSPHRLVDKNTQTPALLNTAGSMSGTYLAETTSSHGISKISSLDWQKLSELTNLAFLELAKRMGIESNPADFASLAVEGM